ncbi:MAG: uncharacterized protein QOH26_1396 [Actinomycetota bacterium]|nr:uncharacterized protein [Actinomycetota bacterium]
MRGLGTIINLLTVGAGGLAGIFVGDRFPERMRHTIMQGIGLGTIAVAVVGFEPLLDADRGLRRAVIMLAALTLGAIIGEALRLDDRLDRLAESLRLRFAPREPNQPDAHSRFAEGFVLASTVFCVGPLTLLGAVEDGLGISIRLLAIKSTLDGIVAVGFASVYGWGVLASLLTIGIYQGGVTALAVLIEPLLTGEVLAELGIIGSVLVLGIGFTILEIKKVNLVNLLPAVFVGPVIAAVVDAIAG